MPFKIANEKHAFIFLFIYICNISSFAFAFEFPNIFSSSKFLDCTVSAVNPILEDMPSVKAILLMKNYQFKITSGDKNGSVTTIEGDYPTEVIETKKQYNIYFSNKRVVINRFSTAFQVYNQGAKMYLASGVCIPMKKQKF